MVNLDDSQTQRLSVTGKVKTIFFENSANFFKIMLIDISDKNIDWNEPEIVVTGSFGEINLDATYRFFGKMVNHPKYGQQFQSANYELVTPTSEKGLVAYLSGEQFKGIGKRTAEKIVELFGTNAIAEIQARPDKLLSVGLTQKKIKMFVDALNNSTEVDNIIMGLNQFGFGSQLSASIYEKYGADTLKTIQENPYQMVFDIRGIGFIRADRIGQQLGLSATAPARLQGAVMQAIFELAESEGDTYTTSEPLVQRAMSLLENSRNVEISPNSIAEQMIQLAHEGKIIGEENRIYPVGLFDAEWQIANQLWRVAAEFKPWSVKDIEKQIRRVEKSFDIVYDEIQQDAIINAINHSLSALTGGPGTGKTTVINGIVAVYARLNDFSLDINDYKDKPFPILLAAPTGRAAKRMSEMTGLPASTIHRLLGITGRESNPDLAGDRELEGGLLIVDEMSMVDTYLFKTLVRAIPRGMQVIFVGDKDQLPSVGPGQIFNDILKSNVITSTALRRIYRQDDNSSIIPLAHSINNGEVPADIQQNMSDRSFIACHASQVGDVISQVVKKAKNKGFDNNQIQVLAPMYKGPAGIDHLNKLLQDIMNPKTSNKQKEITYQDTSYRVGDKVLQLVNNPDLNVFNGEIGRIVSITLAKETSNHQDLISIAFDSGEVEYGRSEWNNITLAFCTSIHKSQGSEFEMVIMPIVHQYNRMLQRNLLYTGITRARKLLILLGEEEAFEFGVSKLAINRHTTLKNRLKAIFNGEEKIETNLDPSAQVSLAGRKSELKKEELAPKKVSTNVNNDKEILLDVETETQQPNYRLTMELINNQTVNAMIGMENITPFQFMQPQTKS